MQTGCTMHRPAGGGAGGPRVLAPAHALGLLAAVLAGCSSPAATGDTAGAKGGGDPPPRGIAALGRLQPRGGLLDVAGTPGTRVGTMGVREGQVVGEGDELFVLDSHPILAAHAEAAEARLRDAQGLCDLEARQRVVLAQDLDLEEAKLQKVDPLDLQVARAQVAPRQGAADKARADRNRLTSLRQKGSAAVSDQELEAAKLQAQVADAELEAAQAQVAKLEQARDLGRKRLAQDREKLGLATERAQLAAQLAAARAASEAARRQRDAARVVAPRAGQVLRILTRAGESIGSRPVLQMGDTEHMVVVAEVSELDILRLRQAAAAGPAPAAIAALGGRLRLAGRLDAGGIGRVVGKNHLLGLNPTFQADDRVVEVEVEVDPADAAALGTARGLSNLQVDVTFPIGEGGPGPAGAADPAGATAARGGP